MSLFADDETLEYVAKIERDNADLRQRNESVLNGQELLRQQAVRIRHAALGITAEAEDTAPDTDTEDIVRDLAAARKNTADTVVVPKVVIDFLCGAGPLDGVWFGDKHPTERGDFWWRKHLRAIEAVKVPEPVAYLQTVSNPGEPDRLLLSITCDRSLHRQLKTGGTYTRKPLYTHPPAQRDGMLRAAEICDKVGARLSAGAGYACKIAAEEIRNSA